MAGQLVSQGQDLMGPQQRVLRSRIIGALLRQARVESGRSLAEVATSIGSAEADLAAYERGQDVPVLVLHSLTQTLQLPLERLLSAPVAGQGEGEAVALTEMADDTDPFEHLPAECREFIQSPRNLPYIQVAMELSRFSAQGLRAMAEALLVAQSE